MKKSLFALAASVVLASALSAQAADINVVALSVDPVVAGQVNLNTDIGKVSKDLSISNQGVGANVDISSTQGVGTINVTAGKAGATLAIQITANTAIDNVGGNLDISNVGVGTNVKIGTNN